MELIMDGRPPFHAYGRNNLLGGAGGFGYGHHMATHNIHAHLHPNTPKTEQVYRGAVNYHENQTASNGKRVAQLHRLRCKYVLGRPNPS